jgi:hypothetical protein
MFQSCRASWRPWRRWRRWYQGGVPTPSEQFAAWERERQAIQRKVEKVLQELHTELAGHPYCELFLVFGLGAVMVQMGVDRSEEEIRAILLLPLLASRGERYGGDRYGVEPPYPAPGLDDIAGLGE